MVKETNIGFLRSLGPLDCLVHFVQITDVSASSFALLFSFSHNRIDPSLTKT